MACSVRPVMFAVVAVFVALPAATASAQLRPPDPSAAATVETDPIECWWRASAGAVRVGEPFTFVLTCAVVETDAAKVVPDQTRLEPPVMQIPPFEVMGGTHAPDLHAGDRRFFQYEYQLRLIGDDLFGKDVRVPELKLTYRVQSSVATATSIEGRERTYVLPAESIRVLSIVPSDATAIRDASAETFGDIDTRVFRANVLLAVAAVLGALAILAAILAIVGLVDRYRAQAPEARRLVGDAAILRSVGRELTAIERLREQSGWTHELAGRALAALRIAASYALGRPVSQSVGDARGNAGREDGSLVVQAGWTGGKRVVVSGSVTSQTVAHELVRRRAGDADGSRRLDVLEGFERALIRLTLARYGRDESIDASALDESLASGRRLHRHVASRNSWPAKQLAALTRAAAFRGMRFGSAR